ncbi:DUF2489 domain-containing protein [Pseudomonas sp. M30-35]|uniref:DUF2489 domain-containing protein n=1 Tax=Pseudomonas sp. M30-35 TaxID=1981174 RepID=UPI000B3BEBFA|nr:DUF2489 domain-containing protein [Pseudomonas sp. M30-35]ARU89428.1 hypothetical protein B9K09_16260 [Pseudomonas sp. M30-35]
MSLLSGVLICVAVALVIALGFYALSLWRKVWSRQSQQRSAAIEQQQRLGEDLKILASSLLDGQLPLIEGVIRIKVLLDNFDIRLSQNVRCQVFHQLYEATAHVPTHADWKALDKTSRRQHEKNFNELELQHKAQAREAARWLLEEAL